MQIALAYKGYYCDNRYARFHPKAATGDKALMMLQDIERERRNAGSS
jgi:hypothetical protein